MSELPSDLTPEEAEYYDMYAEDAWNKYQATGDEMYARMCLAWFAKMMIAERVIKERDGRDET